MTSAYCRVIGASLGVLLGSASILALATGGALGAESKKVMPKDIAVAEAGTGVGEQKIAQAAAPAAPAPAAASSAPTSDDRVERVIVTAQKRKERLVDVPSSVSVVTGKDIKDKTTYNLTEIGEKLPNVNAGGSYSAGFTIRGISSSTAGSGFAPNMGVNVDEVFLGRDRSFDTGVADVERIEVLRGPQGTLYGKNTIAGTINVTTRRPTNAFEALGDIKIGNGGLFEARGTVSGPLIEDMLQVRVTGFTRDRDGFVHNTVLGKDTNEINNFGGRFMAVFRPSDNFIIELRGDSFEQDEDGGVQEVVRTVNGSVLPFPPFNTVPPQNARDRIVNQDVDSFLYRKVYGVSLKAEYDWNGYVLTSITANRRQSSDQVTDNDGGPLNGFDTGRAEGIKRFSQELRLTSPDEGKFTWIVGAYFDDEEDKNLYHIQTGPGFPSAFLGAPFPAVLPAAYREAAEAFNIIDSSSWSVFATGKLDVTEQISLQAGLRYTDEEKDLLYKQGPTRVHPGGPAAGGGIINVFAFPFSAIYPNGFTNTYANDAYSGDVSVSYKFTPDRVAYFRYARGYKAGGFQSDIISPPLPFPVGPGITPDVVFEPETLDAYELGLKASWFDNTVTTNVALFQYDFSNKQEQVNTGVSFLVNNASSAKSDGAELEIYWYPMAGLSLFGNVGYLDATYEKFPCGTRVAGVCRDFDGNRLAGASEWSSSFGGSYVTPFSLISGTDFYVAADADYRGNQYTDPNNTEALKIKAYTIFNARIGLEDEEGRWGVYAWGRNLGDKTVLGGGVAVFNGLYTTRNINFGDSYGIEMRFHF
jgi:iron complex outermembrane recepter protein